MARNTSPEVANQPRDDLGRGPLVGIGGLLTVKRLAPWYAKMLETDQSSDVPAALRFIAPPDRGIGEPEYLQEKVTLLLEKMYERLGQRRMFLVGHSLGGLIATKAGVERPDLVSGVVSLGGVHAGYNRETPATLALRYSLGNPKEGRHLRHDSPFMQAHREKMANEWREDISLDIVSSPWDVLVVPPQGFDVDLPDGRQPEKRLVLPPNRFVENVLRRRLGVKDDVQALHTWYPTEHVNLPRVPVVIDYIDARRRGAETSLASRAFDGLSMPEALPAAA